MFERISVFSMALLLLVTTQTVSQSIPDDYMKPVVFIYLPNDKGDPILAGTGFFVNIRTEIPDQVIPYLVTAKHVVFNKATSSFYNDFFIRYSKKTGGTELRHILVDDPVRVHKDKSVDIAVIPLVTDSTKYEIKNFTQDFILNRDDFNKLDIKAGDDIFFIGLFTPFLGEQKNYPITRFGKIALRSEEKIPWKEQGEEDAVSADLLLLDSHSFGGNSGSPVIFYPRQKEKQSSETYYYLAGIMKGTMGEYDGIQLMEIDTKNTSQYPVYYQSFGVAAIVPAYYLYDILFSDEEKKLRDTFVKKILKQKGKIVSKVAK